MWRHLLIFFILSFARTGADAQVYPPKLLCTSGNDTLQWELPNNTCGAFIGYQIYSSYNSSGPFTLLTEVTDQSRTTYYNPNVSGETIYYFMQSHYDCPGETVLSSDTLDNKSPEKATITGISVTGNSIEISWQPSPSAKTIGYVIYRQIPSGLVPIDTIYNSNTYIDTGALPNDKVEYYDVLALDACDNTSLFNDSLCNSVLLTSSIDECAGTINLRWNPYNYWQAGIERQEIWVSVDGAQAVQHEVIDAGATTYSFTGLEKGKEYCLFVRSKMNGQPVFVNSNTVCQDANILQPMKDMSIVNVNVLPDNTVEVSWVWDTSAEINSALVVSHQTGSDVTTPQNYPVTSDLLPQNVFIDGINNPTRSQISYYISTENDCESTVNSSEASTLYLQAIANEHHHNMLTWTALNIENADVLHYEIFKLTATGEEKIAQTDGATLSYTEMIDAPPEDGSTPCFFVRAVFNITLPDGAVETLESNSNIACVEQIAVIYTPNAFVPRGINREFKPVVAFGKIAKYELLIFDRFGHKLFESHDIDKGWDGRSGDKKIRQGLYVYQIKVVQENGNVVEDNGTVFLMR